MRVLRVLALACAAALWAQDAGLVTRTQVGYTTLKNSSELSAAERGEADRLGEEARRLGREGQYGEAMRALHHGMAIMRHVAWTPEVELAASLEAKPSRAMLEPGMRATVTLSALYRCERPLAEKLTAAVFLLPVGKTVGAGRSLAPRAPIDAARLPVEIAFQAPDGDAGDYNLEVRLARPDGATPDNARAAFVKSVQVHVEALAADVARLRGRLAKLKVPHLAGVPSAEYVLELYARADRGDAPPHRFSFVNEFIWANQLLDMIEGGHDPFAGRKGDFRKAYRSGVDGTLQPYRLVVPASYDANQPTPLVVALHGMGGDENSMLDGYKESLRPEAERLGFLVACPKGREPTSMYRGPAERDVLDVIGEVRRDYKVDTDRIYLMGHSMGGYGTWALAMNHPETFAALGPIAGGGNVAGLEKIKHIAQYVVHGSADKTVPVAASRAMVEAARKLGATIMYVEVPGGGHGDVVAPEFAHMLDFFARQRRGVQR